MKNALYALILMMTVCPAVAQQQYVQQQVVLTRAPRGILMPIGGAAQNDSFVLANIGSYRAAISLVTVGPFTVNPSSFGLFPGTSATVTINPNPATSPFYNAGSVTVLVAGTVTSLTVPVVIAAATPPASPVKADAASKLVVTSGYSGLTHDGSWSVSNKSSTPAVGIVAADMPWLVPQANLITLPPSGGAQVSFASDPKRFAAKPVGAMKSTISFIYLTGSAANPVDRVTATFIDVTKVPLLLSSPPAVAPGETISFLPVVVEPGGVSSDLFFANRGADALPSDLELFYKAADVASSTAPLLADAGTLAAGTAAWFPFAPTSLFIFGTGTGSVQARGADPGNVALAATRSVVPDNVNLYTTSMPILRSDRAVVPGGRLVFAGVEKSAAAQTDLFLQETAGFAATYAVDFFDAAGASLAPRASGSLDPFGAANLRDAAPSGARSAVVTNTSATAAMLAAFAAVVDSSTSDEWTITDPQAGSGPAGDLVLVVPSGAPAGSAFDAWITNSSNAAALVTIGGTPAAPPVKSRVVRRNPASNVPDVQSIVVGAGQTQQIPIAGLPFVHISGPVGAISATGRLTTTDPGRAGAFGTGVPAIPAALASGAGGPASHFFRPIDTAGVAPLTLVVAEVANKPATVRVTIAFNFPAGATLTQHVETSRDYDLAAGRMLTVPDVIRAVAGSSRDVFGDLTNVVVDVTVTGGDGRVLPYIESVDPTSGDLTLAAD